MARKNSGTRPRYEDPVTVAGTVDELPGQASRASIAPVVQTIVDNGGNGWTELDLGGRKPSSVQSMVKQYAASHNIPIACATRDGAVYARYTGNDSAEDSE